MTKENKPVRRAPGSAARKPQVARTTAPAVAHATTAPAQDMMELLGADEGYDFDAVISGELDAAEELPEAVPAKRVLQPELESPKLHKVLAQAGLGSRLEVERWIGEGRITVNNELAHVGQRIQLGDSIKVEIGRAHV